MSVASIILLAIVAGYLCGSIPFGLIIAQAGGAGDVRKIGSGNIGATNVLRTGRKGLAVATLMCDAAKGLVPVVLFATFGPLPAALAGFAAFVGHCYPVWLRFVGGKGIATFVGVVAGFGWPLLLVFAAVWFAVAFATRYSSLAALLATTATLVAASQWPVPILLAVTAMTAITFWRHRANIARLHAGAEGKIGAKG